MSTRWYPIYQKGNPQLRVFLPNYWMKLVKPDDKQPPDVVQFQVPTGMSNHDIKNYLEKIYKVPVAEVRSAIVAGNCRPWRKNAYIIKEDDFRRAYVKLQRGTTFQFPDIDEVDSQSEVKRKLEASSEEAAQNTTSFTNKQDGERSGIPSWFSI